MTRGRLIWLVVGLGCAGALSWGLEHLGLLGLPAALRLGGGLGAGLVLFAVLPGLWPGVARRSALEEALDAPLPAGPARPRSLRDVEMTLRLATSKGGGREVYFRLRPLLRRLAEQRLRAQHLVELDGPSPRAEELLGGDLWELLREGAPAPEQGGGGVAVAKLAKWVERLEGL
jgi:hypothetical protein